MGKNGRLEREFRLHRLLAGARSHRWGRAFLADFEGFIEVTARHTRSSFDSVALSVAKQVIEQEKRDLDESIEPADAPERDEMAEFLEQVFGT